MKMKLKGQCFETVSDIQMESQAVLDSIKERDITELLKRGGKKKKKKKKEIAVYVPKETILKEVAARIE
jgi:hypothetical protein